MNTPLHSPRPRSPLGPTQSSAQSTADTPKISVQGMMDRGVQMLMLSMNETSQILEQKHGERGKSFTLQSNSFTEETCEGSLLSCWDINSLSS